MEELGSIGTGFFMGKELLNMIGSFQVIRSLGCDDGQGREESRSEAMVRKTALFAAYMSLNATLVVCRYQRSSV